MDDGMRFSVILPVCHGGALLRRALKSLRAMDYPQDSYEVIIAARPGDEESERLVDETCCDWPAEARFVRASRAGRSAQLNAACSAARGQVLALTDDDCAPPPDWLRRIEQALAQRPGTDVLGGTDELSGTNGAFDAALDWALNSFAGTGGARAAGAGLGRCYPKLWNMAVRRDAAMRAAIGGAQVFDERLPVHEDVDLCVRVERQGGCIAVAPELRMPHRRETSLRSFLARNFRMAQASRRIGAHRLAHSALVGALVAGMGLLVGAALAPALAPAALGAAGGYALLLLGCAVAGAVERRDLRMVALVPVLLAGLHMARALGYLWPGPAGKERR